jgi:hypothetical protein
MGPVRRCRGTNERVVTTYSRPLGALGVVETLIGGWRTRDSALAPFSNQRMCPRQRGRAHVSAGTVVTPEQLHGRWAMGCPQSRTESAEPSGWGSSRAVVGWWLASDGHWYPPQLHPDSSVTRLVTIDPDPVTGRWVVRWLGSDGKWYAPQDHPDFCVAETVIEEPDPPRSTGWWLASDGNWYAPELHPDA